MEHYPPPGENGGMSEPSAVRPWADPERESDAKRLFPYLTMSVEEYAGRHGADWLCFSFADYRYRDDMLDAWIAALGKIFFTYGRRAECQKAWLTEAELKELREQEEDERGF